MSRDAGADGSRALGCEWSTSKPHNTSRVPYGPPSGASFVMLSDVVGRVDGWPRIPFAGQSGRSGRGEGTGGSAFHIVELDPRIAHLLPRERR